MRSTITSTSSYIQLYRHAVSLNNIGVTLLQKGDCLKAEKTLRDGIRILRSLIQHNSPTVDLHVGNNKDETNYEPSASASSSSSWSSHWSPGNTVVEQRVEATCSSRFVGRHHDSDVWNQPQQQHEKNQNNIIQLPMKIIQADLADPTLLAEMLSSYYDYGFDWNEHRLFPPSNRMSLPGVRVIPESSLYVVHIPNTMQEQVDAVDILDPTEIAFSSLIMLYNQGIAYRCLAIIGTDGKICSKPSSSVSAPTSTQQHPPSLLHSSTVTDQWYCRAFKLIHSSYGGFVRMAANCSLSHKFNPSNIANSTEEVTVYIKYPVAVTLLVTLQLWNLVIIGPTNWKSEQVNQDYRTRFSSAFHMLMSLHQRQHQQDDVLTMWWLLQQQQQRRGPAAAA